MIRIVLLQYEHRIVTIRNKLQYEMLPKRIAAIRIVSNGTNYRIVTIRMLAVRYFFHSTIRTSGEKNSVRFVLLAKKLRYESYFFEFFGSLNLG